MFQDKPAFIDRWRSICQAMLDLPIWSNPMECSALLLDLAEPSAVRATIGRPRSKAARQQTRNFLIRTLLWPTVPEIFILPTKRPIPFARFFQTVGFLP